MKFRPCIDIHNGKVKQIVGGSLSDTNNDMKENFVSNQDAKFYASMYKKDKLYGGHIILLNKADTKEYDLNVLQAMNALKEFYGGLQIGGGINNRNAASFLNAGASHVIVTSYVFHDGNINYENLNKLLQVVGKERLVLDLSCRKKDGNYYIVTNRWQTFTKEIVTPKLLDTLSSYCDEFLIHAVDVEGKSMGIEEDLIPILNTVDGFPVTYAGGIANTKDLDLLYELGQGNIDFTVGSALDLFGGNLVYDEIKGTYTKIND